MATEACGGGTPDLGLFLEVSVFIRPDGIENKSGGPTRESRAPQARPGGWARLPSSWLPRDSSPVSFSSGIFDIFHKKSRRKFYSVWTPPEKGSKTRKEQELAFGTELIG